MQGRHSGMQAMGWTMIRQAGDGGGRGEGRDCATQIGECVRRGVGQMDGRAPSTFLLSEAAVLGPGRMGVMESQRGAGPPAPSC